jgi:glycosyltransferase involved in cell wall biosynthesis
MNNLIVIPALNPTDRLVTYVDDLIQFGAEHIIIVNDGSNEERQVIFEELRLRKECHILVHQVNQGKGRALKDAFLYILKNDAWKGKGVITADADGQHLVQDLLRVDTFMKDCVSREGACLVLGCRSFARTSIPLRSWFGNRLTSVLFRLLYGASITDTQTGLRGISYELLSSLTQLRGERFEYEMNMLIDTALHKIPIHTVKIETVYLDNNSESHFHPIIDSFKIYQILLGSFFRYACSSVLSSLIDLLIFTLFDFFLPSGQFRIFTATVIARIFSSFFNYWCNKKLVFQDPGAVHASILRYYLLCVAVMFCSAGFVTLFSFLPVPNTLVKIVVDSILYLINYYIQKQFIFVK